MSRFPTPQTSITVNGRPLAEWQADQDGRGDRPPVTETGPAGCTRRVAPGKTLSLHGRMLTEGTTVVLSPEDANFYGRAGQVCHPAEYDALSRPPAGVRVVQTGRATNVAHQGPRYDRA